MSFNPTQSPSQYRGIDAAFVTPADTAGVKNVAGRKFIQVCGAAGTVTFRHDDLSLSVAIPLALNQSFELGANMTHIMATGTTATNIASYY